MTKSIILINVLIIIVKIIFLACIIRWINIDNIDLAPMRLL